MAALIATASPTSVPPSSPLDAIGVVRASRPTLRPSRVMTRGAVMTAAGHLASLARPIAIAWFARLYGTRSLGSLLLIWTCIELGARFATLGIDRGVQRWADGRRTAAAISGMVLAGGFGFAIAAGLSGALPRFAALEVGALPAARVLLLVGLPLTAIGNVALRAARGEAQIATYVLARGVTEPLLLLLAGLVLSPMYSGSVALPAAWLISVAGGAAVAAIGLARAFGVGTIAATLVRPRTWPVRELVRTSYPLGIADLLQSAQGKLDLVAVAVLTFSSHQVASYGIAAEVAGAFVVLRMGLDQVVAPVATDAHGDRRQLVQILTTAIRWAAIAAAIVAFVIVAAPDVLLRWFGGSEAAVVVLLVLAAGRAIELVLAPAASILAVTGEPKLSLLDAAAGLALSVIGQLAAAALGLGPVGIAAASSAGVMLSSLLAVAWLARFEGVAPSWRSIAPP